MDGNQRTVNEFRDTTTKRKNTNVQIKSFVYTLSFFRDELSKEVRFYRSVPFGFLTVVRAIVHQGLTSDDWFISKTALLIGHLRVVKKAYYPNIILTVRKKKNNLTRKNKVRPRTSPAPFNPNELIYRIINRMLIINFLIKKKKNTISSRCIYCFYGDSTASLRYCFFFSFFH